MQEHVPPQYFNPGKRSVGVDWAGELQVLEEYMLKLLGIDCMCCNDCAAAGFRCDVATPNDECVGRSNC